MMEWNSRTLSDWDWESLVVFSAKAVQIPKQLRSSNHDIEGDGGIDNGSVYSSGCGGFSGSDLGHGSSSKSSLSASADSSLKEGMHSFKPVDCFPINSSEKKELTSVDGTRNFPILGDSVASGVPMIGLKLGKRTYFENMCASSATKTPPFPVTTTPSATTTKRSRASYHSTQSSRCQVEGCNLDLKTAKDYHRRHRICESHSKSPKVIVAGMERRFCQQCSRFHDLSEFDEKKRSCRRRLSDHNARRRRPQPEEIQFNSARLSPSFYDSRRHMNLVLNRVPIPVANPTWQNTCGFKATQAGSSMIRPAKAGGIDRQLYLPTDEMLDATSMLRINSERVLSFGDSTSRLTNQGLEASAIASNLDVAPDIRRALSLLSTNSWGLNEPESTSFDQLMHVNQTSVTQPVMHAELPSWAPSSSEHVRIEHPPSDPRMHSLDLYNNGNSQFQEFQLFKAPHESGCFYSKQIN